MKRGIDTHPKTQRLARRLGLTIAETVGYLEMLTHFTAKWTPRGDIGRYNDEEIAQGLYWREDRSPNELIQALIESGFLERCAKHRLVVHDWAEHTDQNTKRGLQRRGETFVVYIPLADNVPPHPTLGEPCLDNEELSPAKGEPCLDNDESCLALARVRQPEPVPEPEPIPPPPPQGGRASAKAEIAWPVCLDTQPFRRSWDEYTAYRRERRLAVLKPISVQKQLERLALWGHDRAIAAINHTIANGYQGIVEPKEAPFFPVNGHHRGPPDKDFVYRANLIPQPPMREYTEEEIYAGLRKTYDENGQFRTPPKNRTSIR